MKRTFTYHCRQCGPIPIEVTTRFVPFGIFCPNVEAHPEFVEGAQREVPKPVVCEIHGIHNETIVDEALHRKGCPECLREIRNT